MSALSRKIQYTLDSVNDITAALTEKDFDMTTKVLGEYGDLIRTLNKSVISNPMQGGIYPIHKDTILVSNDVIYEDLNLYNKAPDINKIKIHKDTILVSNDVIYEDYIHKDSM